QALHLDLPTRRRRRVEEGGGIRKGQLSSAEKALKWLEIHHRRTRLSELRTHDVTALLIDWRGGDAGAVEKLMPLVHAELRRIAKRHMAGERPDHLLQATALVNEVYLRLIDVR